MPKPFGYSCFGHRADIRDNVYRALVSKSMTIYFFLVLIYHLVITLQTSTAASYSKFVSREMSRAEALLKVILSPIDSVADTYRALFPEGTPMEFQRILELKVILACLNPFPRSQSNRLEARVWFTTVF